MAGVLFVAASCGDALDGLVARATRTESPGGAVLDASVDRYEEFFVSVASPCSSGRAVLLTVTLAALVASFMVSYGSAKAEALRIPTPPSRCGGRSARPVSRWGSCSPRWRLLCRPGSAVPRGWRSFRSSSPSSSSASETRSGGGATPLQHRGGGHSPTAAPTAPQGIEDHADAPRRRTCITPRSTKCAVRVAELVQPERTPILMTGRLFPGEEHRNVAARAPHDHDIDPSFVPRRARRGARLPGSRGEERASRSGRTRRVR